MCVSVQASTKAAERRVVMWQVFIAMVVVLLGAVLAASLLVMPRTGHNCKLCSTVSCQDFLGWQCKFAPLFSRPVITTVSLTDREILNFWL